MTRNEAEASIVAYMRAVRDGQQEGSFIDGRVVATLAREMGVTQDRLLQLCHRSLVEVRSTPCDGCRKPMRLRAFGPERYTFEFRCDNPECWPMLPLFWREELEIMERVQRMRATATQEVAA